MKSDITSTSFGIIIAYLLPGLLGLFAIRFWSPEIDNILRLFITANADIGLFFITIFLCISLGLIITVFRWLLYELVICKYKLDTEDFKSLGTNESKLNAFRAAVDEHYRYHQFWGGVTIVLPIYTINIIVYNCSTLTASNVILIIVLAAFLEIILIIASKIAFDRYVARSKSILNN